MYKGDTTSTLLSDIVYRYICGRHNIHTVYHAPLAKQAMWAWVVSIPVTMANFSPNRIAPMGIGGWASIGVFAAGLAIETIADYQVQEPVE